ncbi:FHA domain-containing protein [Planctomonas sp. JC2975]|uniref:FHA domain-containing protein FhaB/FipA n=1 Tax=Planctomonas sp. JC2975 TaxID=2729626 RepID=UPI001473627F|nr:FHA domain-containing protein [Planctomonas sp. JC2975]NNC12626.1 FHA domain-containing protein [Planctomonas sp. JC2975]
MTVSTLTLLVLRIGFLLLLWLFVFAIVYALRSDLFGQRVRKLQSDAAPGPFANVPSAHPASAPTAGVSAATGAVAGAAVTGDHPLAGLARPTTGPIDRQSAPATGRHPRPGEPTGAFPNRPMATVLTANKLVITSGPRRGTEVTLGNEPITIGRSGESGLVIRDDYTSTHHARLMLWNNEWMIQDLDSTNGTFLDGQRVTVPTQVPLDAPIKIGTTTFELRR